MSTSACALVCCFFSLAQLGLHDVTVSSSARYKNPVPYQPPASPSRRTVTVNGTRVSTKPIPAQVVQELPRRVPRASGRRERGVQGQKVDRKGTFGDLRKNPFHPNIWAPPRREATRGIIFGFGPEILLFRGDARFTDKQVTGNRNCCYCLKRKVCTSFKGLKSA
jgi:hypothetical protein